MDFDGPDGWDQDLVNNEEEQKEMMEKVSKIQLEKAGQNKAYLQKVLGILREAEAKNII